MVYLEAEIQKHAENCEYRVSLEHLHNIAPIAILADAPGSMGRGAALLRCTCVHPFEQIIRREKQCDEEKVLIAAVVSLSTKAPYTAMTFTQIYDALLAEHAEHFGKEHAPALQPRA